MNYTRLSHLEHILLRSETYIGSKEPITIDTWIPEDGKVVNKTVTFVPAFIKVFDEVLTNAADNKVRDPQGTTYIKVTFDESTISVENNGQGIPVEIHEKEGIYTPELIFGHLLTGSNFDDSKERTTGGRNGLGVKLTNVFSKSFSVEVVCAGKKYKQTWTDNMTKMDKSKVSSVSKTDYTKVIFTPDLERFGMSSITEDHFSLIKKRVYDLCGTVKNIKVFLNGEYIKCKSFKDYVLMYPTSVVHETPSPRWEVAIGSSEGSFQQVSFVNSIPTYRGGTHVSYITDQIVSKLQDHFIKKYKATVKPAQIKNHLFVFINCLIVNPTFDSQTKETLTLRPSSFGSSCQISDGVFKKLLTLDIIERILKNVREKEDSLLKKTDGSRRRTITGIPDLCDANKAGTKDSDKCTLFLTEGKSALSFAISGISAIKSGRDTFGAFPLRGKLLNVRDTTSKQVSDNKELSELKKVLGLEHGKVYTSTKDLRYGSIGLLTDQDSVTGDTPLLLSDGVGVYIKTIDSIGDHFEPRGEKEVSSSSLLVWSDKGWSKIRQVIRHETLKQIYRVTTTTGQVDVTEDHSLLTDTSLEVTPKDVNVGDKLLASFPFTDNFLFSSEYLDEHFVWGAFLVNGNIENDTWILKCKDPSILKLVSFIIGKTYKLSSVPHVNCTIIVNSKELVTRYTELMKNASFLNLPLRSKSNFLQGVFSCCGDSLPSGETFLELENSTKLVVQTVFWMAKSTGYSVRLQNSGLLLSKSWTSEPSVITKIELLPIKRQFVYDLETECSHFQAGIGDLIVHNTDGFHISSLVMNWLDCFWPSLLELEGFLTLFITPIVKCTKAGVDTSVFYNLAEYETWKETHISGFKIKYYKGLGTSTDAESKVYFTKMDMHLKKFKKLRHGDSELLDLVFNKKRASDRKDWLLGYNNQEYLDYSLPDFTISDFINKSLIQFSISDNIRSIPSLCDGLKPSQRKVIFTVFKRKLDPSSSELKVSQLASATSEATEYRHGEVSLCGTIVSLAQDYVGSNNINLLDPVGQFGKRHQGGKDAASPRYIYTKMTNLTRLIFKQEDDLIVPSQQEDNQLIEPVFYVPIIPMVLVNGADGIGSGYSTKIPCYNPMELINVTLDKLERDIEFPTLMPWYRGFTGTITCSESDKYILTGKYQLDGNKLDITELPIGSWTLDYKEELEKLLDSGVIKDYVELHSDQNIHFRIKLVDPTIDILKIFKLESVVRTSNLVLFDRNSRLKKYNSVQDILSEYYSLRLEYYSTRKIALMTSLDYESKLLFNKIRFTTMINSGELKIYQKKRADVKEDLSKMEFDRRDGSFDYLLNITVGAFTKERVDSLNKELSELEKKIDFLGKTSVKQLWINDLQELKSSLSPNK